MGLALNIITGIVSIIGFAPMVIFIGGLAKLTDVVNNNNWRSYQKQVAYMLEWYLIAAGCFYFLVIAIISFIGQLKRCGTFLTGWLMCSCALLIYSTTKYLILIQAIDSRGTYTDPATGETFSTASLKYMRAVVAGEISVSAWSFFLTILINWCITSDIIHQKKDAMMPPNTA